MSIPGQVVVIYTSSEVKREELWQQLEIVMEAHGKLLVPRKDIPMIDVDGDTIFLPEEGTVDEWKHIVKQAFLQSKGEGIVIFDPDWGDLYGPDFLAILFQFRGPPWAFSIEMSFEAHLFWQGKRLCDEVMELCKDMFVHIPCDFGFACHKYLYKRHLRIFKSYKKNAKALRFVPTMPAEDDPNYEFVEEWSAKGSLWAGVSPVWFYLLSRERYEASKPYLEGLVIEEIERSPWLKLRGYGLQRVDELPNGGALLFFDYPYTFEE